MIESTLNLVLLGPPGAGKGTQARMLTNRYDIPQKDRHGGKRHVALQKGVSMLTKISHIGIAVHTLAEAIPFYRDTLCMTFKGVEEVVEYKVKVAFFQIGESKIELLEPTSEESFLVEFLEKNGQGIHHIAYEVEDIEAAIRKLEEDGTRMIDTSPRQGAHGAKVAFIHQESSQGVLTELCQMGHLL